MTPVSIVMATWNRADLLKAGLDSIFKQEYPNLEVIIVDDGSTDNTKEICSRYPVRYFYRHKPEWCGQGPAVNAGIRRATHDIIILQSPEVVHQQSDTIKRLVDAVKDDDKCWIMARVLRQRQPNGPADWEICSPRVPRPCAMFLSALWRKWLLEVRGFDEDYTHAWAEDDDLADRITKYCGVKQVFTDNISGIHLWHPPYCEQKGLNSLGMYNSKTAAMKKGKISHIRNLDREWGYLPKEPLISTTFSIIIPSVGRGTLQKTVDSVLPQLKSGDELILCGEKGKTIIPSSVHYISLPLGLNSGASERNVGLTYARGNFLYFLDDDNVMQPGALDVMKQMVALDPKVLHIFRIDVFIPGESVPIKMWKTQEICDGNTDTQMLVTPNLRILPRWNERKRKYHDTLFAHEVAALIPVKFHEDVIASVWPSDAWGKELPYEDRENFG